MGTKLSVLICVLALFTLYSNFGFSQNNIKIIEQTQKAKKIDVEIPEGKALLIFETTEDYIFDSNIENLVQPQKKDGIYKLYIKSGSQAITIKYGTSVTAFLNYGQFTENSYPPLKSQEIKYYKLELSTALDCWNVTNDMIKKGENNFQALFEKEAMIIINVVPSDLKLNINSDIDISEMVTETGRYKLYLKPEKQTLSIKAENYDEAIIEFDSLLVKEVRYYYVQIPPTVKESEIVDVNIKIGSFSIESTPPGATIQMVGNPFFNQGQIPTPYTLDGFKEGTEIITLELDRYEPVTDTIFISKNKGKKATYKLIPKFAFINCDIEPPFPISEIFVDGIKIESIQNDIDYELLKGNHKIEIRALHYYPEIMMINLVAGKTNEINVKLAPIMGTLSITPGTNAENADVYINSQKIGKLPITDYPLQEGDYKLILKKSGFDMKKREMTVQIQEDAETLLKEIEMVNIKEITIESSPSGAAVMLDNKTVGKTPVDIKVGIGEHSISLELENYDSFVKNIEVTPDQSTFNYKLNPKSFPLTLKVKKPYNADELDVYADGRSIGTIEKSALTVSLPTKSYELTFKDPKKNNKTIYKISVRHPSKINKKTLCIPSKTGFSLFTAGTILPLNNSIEGEGSLNPIYTFDVLQFSFYGISLDLTQLQMINSSLFSKENQTLVSWINPEFRVGGNIFSWADISAFINGYYKYNFLEEEFESGISETKVNVIGYSYGAALTMYARTTTLFSFTIKAGYTDDKLEYENWNGQMADPTQSLHEKYSFISFGLNIYTSGLDGKILRLWKRPLSQVGAF